jgi:hypothetical protein
MPSFCKRSFAVPAGERPPLSEADWEAEFAKYRASPEFRAVHAGMTLPEFKFIFWMEYAHRCASAVLAELPIGRPSAGHTWLPPATCRRAPFLSPSLYTDRPPLWLVRNN